MTCSGPPPGEGMQESRVGSVLTPVPVAPESPCQQQKAEFLEEQRFRSRVKHGALTHTIVGTPWSEFRDAPQSDPGLPPGCFLCLPGGALFFPVHRSWPEDRAVEKLISHGYWL